MKLLSSIPASLESPETETYADTAPRATINFGRALTLAPPPSTQKLESVVDFEERISKLGNAGERLLALAHRFDDIAHDDLKKFRVLVEWGAARDIDPLPDTPLTTPEALILAAYPRPQLAGMLLNAFRRLRSDFQRRVLAEAAIALEGRYPRRAPPADADLSTPEGIFRAAYPQYGALIAGHCERLSAAEQRVLIDNARARLA